MKLVIDRSKWLRGEGSSNSKLLRESDGKMCCLGFYAKQCGYTDEEILQRAAPGDVARTKGVRQGFEPLISSGTGCQCEECRNTPRLVNSSLCSELMNVNDDETVLDAERERFIAGVLEWIGVEVEFVG